MDTVVSVKEELLPGSQGSCAITEKGAWIYVLGQVIVVLGLIGCVIGAIAWYAEM